MNGCVVSCHSTLEMPSYWISKLDFYRLNLKTNKIYVCLQCRTMCVNNLTLNSCSLHKTIITVLNTMTVPITKYSFICSLNNHQNCNVPNFIKIKTYIFTSKLNSIVADVCSVTLQIFLIKLIHFEWEIFLS